MVFLFRGFIFIFLILILDVQDCPFGQRFAVVSYSYPKQKDKKTVKLNRKKKSKIV